MIGLAVTGMCQRVGALEHGRVVERADLDHHNARQARVAVQDRGRAGRAEHTRRGVIALIMIGWATPSEAAAFGCLGVIIVAVAFRCLTWKSTMEALDGAGRVTVMALLIIFGSATFANVLAVSGSTEALIDWIIAFELSGYWLMMFVVLLILGMFMDQLSMMLLTVPIFFPLVEVLDFGMPVDVQLIWFGVIVLLAMEISFTTPPFGLLLFVMQGVAPPGTTFVEICLAALPFMGCALLLVVLMVIYPEIAVWLPFLGRAPGG